MSVNGNYHTTIRTLYQIVDPYFRLDARVENWYEETRSNRRLVQVGVTYQF